MDYDKLLDEWAEKLYKEVDIAQDKELHSRAGEYKQGWLKGYATGLLMATSILNRMETREKRKEQNK